MNINLDFLMSTSKTSFKAIQDGVRGEEFALGGTLDTRTCLSSSPGYYIASTSLRIRYSQGQLISEKSNPGRGDFRSAVRQTAVQYRNKTPKQIARGTYREDVCIRRQPRSPGSIVYSLTSG